MPTCDICGEELRIYNEYGITVGCYSCKHWEFHGDIYPSLWDDESRDALDAEVEAGLAILESREQGGYYYWSMTPEHPEYEKAVERFNKLMEQRDP